MPEKEIARIAVETSGFFSDSWHLIWSCLGVIILGIGGHLKHVTKSTIKRIDNLEQDRLCKATFDIHTKKFDAFVIEDRRLHEDMGAETRNAIDTMKSETRDVFDAMKSETRQAIHETMQAVNELKIEVKVTTEIMKRIEQGINHKKKDDFYGN